MSSNQRTSFRCPAPEEGVKALLALPRRKVLVDLIDESAGGFAICLREKQTLKLGDEFKLRTNAGWCEVKVVHLARKDSDTHVGLQRLGEISDPRLESQLTRNSLPPLMNVGGSKKGPLSVVLTLMIVVVAGFSLSIATPIWLTGISQWLHRQHWTNNNANVENESDARPVNLDPVPAHSQSQ